MGQSKNDNIIKGMEYFHDSLAEELLHDSEMAREYLQDEGINFKSIVKERVERLRLKVAESKLKKGRVLQMHLQKRMNDFLTEIEGMPFKQIQKMYPSLPRLAARKFDDSKLTQDEINDLMQDGSFLTFLERRNDENRE